MYYTFIHSCINLLASMEQGIFKGQNVTIPAEKADGDLWFYPCMWYRGLACCDEAIGHLLCTCFCMCAHLFHHQIYIHHLSLKSPKSKYFSNNITIQWDIGKEGQGLVFFTEIFFFEMLFSHWSKMFNNFLLFKIFMRSC